MTRLSSTTALLTLGLCWPAMADLQPGELVEILTAEVNGDGEVLSLNNLRQDGDLLVAEGYKAALVEDDFAVTLTGGEVVFRSVDGTVEVDAPERSIMRIDLAEGDLETITFDIVSTEPNYVFSREDEASSIEFTHNSDRVLIENLDLRPRAGADALEADVDFSFAFEALQMTGLIDGSGEFAFDLAADRVLQDLSMDIEGQNAQSTTVSQDVMVSGIFNGPVVRQESDALAAEDEFRFSYSVGQSTASSTQTTPQGVVAYDMVIESSTTQIGLENGVFEVVVDGEGLAVDLELGFLPMPGLSFALPELAVEFSMPLLASDQPQEARLNYLLRDLQISDAVWNLFDGAGLLPRDPATVEIAMSGELLIDQDLVSEGVFEAIEAPLQPVTAKIDAFRVSAIGAEVVADGAFEFDMVDGMPRPIGELLVEMAGINAVMANLTALGVIQQEQILPVRMMLGIFAIPGEEPDTYISEIEAGADGVITANGVPFQ